MPKRPSLSSAAAASAAALLLSGAGTAAAADVPGNRSTTASIGLEDGKGGVSGVFERKGDVDTYRVTLRGGKNYAFDVQTVDADRGCARLRLRNRDGRALGSAEGFSHTDDGFEFRPNATATFFAEFSDCSPGGHPVRYSGGVAVDARGDRTTAATIAVGREVRGAANWSSDTDFFRTRLARGKRYTVSVSHPDTYIRLVDSAGKVLFTEFSQSRTFQARASGTYYVAVTGIDDFGVGYTLRLTSP